MSELEQLEISGGNTEIPPKSSKKQTIQCLYYCFTFNNYTEKEIEQLEQIFQHETDWYIFQEEKGESGTIHLQGIIKLKRKQRITELKKWNNKIHWETTKSISGSIAYCQKTSSRCGKIYSRGITISDNSIIKVEEPYGWQLDVISLIESVPDKRKIHWFWEPNGNMGKSSLCKYLVVKYNALILSGKASDMFHAISKAKNRHIIIIDCPRSNFDYINYGALEQIKNGLIFSGKYDSSHIVFNTPHIIVFANEEPNYNSMSADRWDVRRISL